MFQFSRLTDLIQIKYDISAIVRSTLSCQRTCIEFEGITCKNRRYAFARILFRVESIFAALLFLSPFFLLSFFLPQPFVRSPISLLSLITYARLTNTSSFITPILISLFVPHFYRATQLPNRFSRGCFYFGGKKNNTIK